MSELDVREIMAILPHRYPLLLIDRITEFEPLKFARGYKNVAANEPVFSGHFPGNPLLPGIYMVEAMAQLGGTTIMPRGDMTRMVPYLAAIDKMKFRRPVIPGDRLDMETRVLRTRSNIGWVAASAYVDGTLAVSGELTFLIRPNAAGFALDAPILHL